MLVVELNEPQKKSVLTLAYMLMMADGRIRPEEGAFLKALGRALGFGPDTEPGEPDVHLAAKPFDSRESRMSATVTLLALAYADGEYHETEAAIIEDFCREVGVSDGELFQMRNWVLRQQAQIREFSEMVGRGPTKPTDWYVFLTRTLDTD